MIWLPIGGCDLGVPWETPGLLDLSAIPLCAKLYGAGENCALIYRNLKGRM
jgi:hypothetical protein